MSLSGEIFGWTVALIGVAVTIRWFGFILDSLGEAIDDSVDQGADGYRSFVPTDVWETKLGAENCGRGGGTSDAELLGTQQLGNRTKQINSLQTNSNTQPTGKLAGQGVK